MDRTISISRHLSNEGYEKNNKMPSLKIENVMYKEKKTIRADANLDGKKSLLIKAHLGVGANFSFWLNIIIQLI